MMKSRSHANYIMHLWPNKVICPYSDSCMEACLKTAGRGRFDSVKAGRQRRTRMWHQERIRFLDELQRELELALRRREHPRAKVFGLPVAVRLNGTSDIAWEDVLIDGKSLMELFPSITFYDYTKNHTRDPKPFKNYSLTLSRGSSNEEECLIWLGRKAGNVAVVFQDKLPKAWKGFKVLDGDKDDLRFLDRRIRIVGLKAKGKAKHDTSGFVVRSGA
jgi:hypothetical protein